TELLPPTRSLPTPPRATARQARRRARLLTRRSAFARRSSVDKPRWLANHSSRSERRLAREGFEPSKPLGRQIYSLLRLTASLPRQASVCVGKPCFWSYLKDRMHSVDGAGEGI